MITKIKDIYNREGILSVGKRGVKYIINRIRIGFLKKVTYMIKKSKINASLDEMFSGDYERIIVFRGTFGWNTKLFQRHQQIAKSLAKEKCLMLFEVTRHTEKVNFLNKVSENLYLIDYELDLFVVELNRRINDSGKQTYLQIYSTAWDIDFKVIESYISSGYTLLYEYIDELNPVVAGLDYIPENVIKIFDYALKNKDVLVVTSASRLYDNARDLRKTDEFITLSSNGVDVAHFFEHDYKSVECMEEIKSNYDLIIGYYGAIATWFDYDTVKELAKKNLNVAFVIIGVVCDNSLKESRLEECSNVFIMEALDYDILPDYANYFDIAWIPFKINDVTKSTNPVKAFEYMALGKFIISSDLPECRKYKSINIAKNYEEYQKLIDEFRERADEDYKKLLKKEALENSWDNRAKDILMLMERYEEYERKN